MKSTDLNEVLNSLLNILPKAGEILRHYSHSNIVKEKMKGKIDFVTNADLEVDHFLHQKLKDIYPAIPIISEENVSDIDKINRNYLQFIIDPLDGTANFSRGDSNYSISAALVSKRNPLIGVVYTPNNKSTFWARYDRKYAYCNGKRITVSSVSDLSDAEFTTDFSHEFKAGKETARILKKIYSLVLLVKIRGCASMGILRVSNSLSDIYHCVNLMPWDMAAAGLIAQKAGALVTDKDGRDWNPFVQGILVANPLLHKKFIQSVLEKP